MRLRAKRAVSGNLFTTLIVGGFVAAVVFALVWTSYLPSTQQGTTLSFQQLSLFGGSPSVHSYTVSCSGAAQLQVYAQNPTPNPIQIESITISGSAVANATIYVALSNSCLNLSEAGLSVPAGGDYQLVGYVSAPISFASTYRCVVVFNNGQMLNKTVIAQS